MKIKTKIETSKFINEKYKEKKEKEKCVRGGSPKTPLQSPIPELSRSPPPLNVKTKAFI